MHKLELHYDYELRMTVIHDWWTDLSGTGYVGVNLKSLRPVGKEGEKTLVETKMEDEGDMNMTLVEKLSPNLRGSLDLGAENHGNRDY